MWKLKSDRRFKEFLSSDKRGIVAATILVLGAVLLMLGGNLKGGEESESFTLEERTAELCSLVNGVGECRVMITYGDDESVYAVAVLCDGAEAVSVQREITELTTSLFGIGANRVTILKISK